MQKCIFLLLTLILLPNCNLYSKEVLSFKIKSFSMTLANLTITHHKADQKIIAEASSCFIGNLGGAFKNYYEISYKDENFQTIGFQKTINQKKLKENRKIRYNLNKNVAYRKSSISDTLSKKYDIFSSTRDVFSALFYIRFNKQAKPFFLDAASYLWKIKPLELGSEIIDTEFGKKKCRKVKIQFIRMNKKAKEKTDFLTYGIANDKNELFFWFEEKNNNMPLRALCKTPKMKLHWILKNVEN